MLRNGLAVCLLLPFLHDLWFKTWIMLWALKSPCTYYSSLLYHSTCSNLPLTWSEIWRLYFSKLVACLTRPDRTLKRLAKHYSCFWKGLIFSLYSSVIIIFRKPRVHGKPIHIFSTTKVQRRGKKPERLLPWNKAGNIIKDFNCSWHFWFCCCRRPSCQNWQSKTPWREALNYISDHFINHLIIKRALFKLSI